MKKVRQIQESIVTHPGVIETAELNDLASLLKAWFGSFPRPIVTKEAAAELTAAEEAGTFALFANQLPPLEKAALMYLIGFLRRMAGAAEVTKMTPKNLAICFAPNIVDLTGLVDPTKAARLAEQAQVFIVALIEEWDTSEVYPLTEDMLTKIT
jgi:hypothetical protein